MADDPAAEDAEPEPVLIDAHHHVWDLTRRPQPWLDEPGLEPLRRSFTTADLRRDAGGLGGRPLRGAVQVQCLPSSAETQELLAAAADDPLVLGVVGWVDLTADDVGGELDRLAALPGGDLLVGVRHLVQGEADPRWLLRADVRRGLDAVAARGLAYDLLVLPHQLPAAADLARSAPHVRFVLDHCAKPPLRRGVGGEPALAEWAQALGDLAAAPGVTCKLSGLVTEADADWSVADLRPAVAQVLDAFGPARTMFGSDWPVCVVAGGWQAWADTADELLRALSDDERDDVLAGCAVRSYRLTCTDTPTTEEAPCS